MGLSKLNARIECDELVFWGKITGLKNDYYIAMGLRFVKHYEFPAKVFYWALGTDFEFKEMPDLNNQYDAKINNDKSYFTGNPDHMIVQVKPAGEEGEAAEEEPKEEAEDGEDGAKKAAIDNSDVSEEEEIKVPLRDLTGKCFVTDTNREGQTNFCGLRNRK